MPKKSKNPVGIKPYEKNPKKHPDSQLKQIANSLREFGWQQPIVVDKNGIIIVGHGRWFAYKKYPEGIKKPRIEVADLTEEKAKAYRLADNKLNESEWDMGLAIEELKGLSDEMFDLTGFDRYLLSLDNVENVEIGFDQLGVITFMPPESPKLKEKAILYIDEIDSYEKVKEAIVEGKIGVNDILGLL